MAAVAGSLLNHPRSRAQRVQKDWQRAVGAGLARHSEPERLADGVLTIRVDSPAWMQELAFLKPELLQRLGEGSNGMPVVRDIRFKQGTLRLADPTPDNPAPPPQWPPALPEEEQRARALVAAVTDPELAGLLARIYLKHLVRERTGGCC